ncbi:MAG: ABC transporter ATP-binding protein [Armatimonadota bacterium]|mgnify:CR=1 FL=1
MQKDFKSDYAVSVHDLCKSFILSHGRPGTLKGLFMLLNKSGSEKVEALRNVRFNVAKGETLAITGKNGSGKSTLLGVLARVYKPTSGSISINGRLSTLLDLGAGFHPDLTGVENIYLNGAILGLSRRELKRCLDDIVDFAELHQFIDAPIRTYSNGMMMRLGFSIAIQTDPDIMLVDEVLAVGDEAFQQKCYAKVKEIQQKGKTIIFVSHDLEAVRRVATRAIWMEHGRIRMDGDVGNVLDAYISAYGSPGELSNAG